MFDNDQLTVIAAGLAMLISMYGMKRQHEAHKENEETQARLASLERDLAKKANALREEANLTQEAIKKIHEQANELQRQANLTQQHIAQLHVSSDDLARTQLRLAKKMELEPYFSAKWRKSSPDLNRFSRQLRAWLELASAHRDNFDIAGPPAFAGVLDHKSIDWSYSPELGELLEQLETRMDFCVADLLEHRKLLKMGNSALWRMRRMLDSTADDDRTIPSLGDPLNRDDDDLGIFGSRAQYHAWVAEFSARIGMAHSEHPREIALSAEYQALIKASHQRMNDHLDVARSLSTELHRAIEENDARFLER